MKKKNVFRVFSAILSTVLTLTVVLGMVACTPTPPTPPAPDPDPGEEGVVELIKKGDTELEYTIAYSAVDSYASDLSVKIRSKIIMQLDVSAPERYKSTAKTNEKEILIGNTDRQLSKDLVAAVDAANESGEDLVWGYAYRDGKLAFYANSKDAAECGWNAFLDAVFTDDALACDEELWVIGFKYLDELKAEKGTLFEGKVISFMGDSITSFEGHSYPGNVTAYDGKPDGAMAFLTNYKDTYWYKIANGLGMTIGVNDGWSGSRVGWDGVNEVHAGGLMVNEDAVMSSQNRIDRLDDNGNPDFIVVYAGTNDIRREPMGSINDVDWDTLLSPNLTAEQRAELPVDNFARSTASMLAGLKMTYPDAHILVLIPTWVEVDTGRGHDEAWVKANVKAFGDLYIEVCRRFDVDYVDIRDMCSFEERSEYLGDNLHPNKKGMQTIFEMCEEYYKKLMLDMVQK